MPVPTSVIANLLGAPQEDFEKWAAWSDEVVQGTYPTKYRNERGEGLAGAHPEFTAYVDHQVALRRREPRDDFMSLLLDMEVDGRRLTDVERAHSPCSSSSPGTRPPVTSSATSCGRSSRPTVSCSNSATIASW